MSRWQQAVDWLDRRTGIRAGRHQLLDEPITPGVNWWFVLGSILLFLIGLQVLSGLVLAMYYVPSPEHAYDSVRYITEQLAFGSLLRGLHFFGASFIVIAAVVHMLRVVLFGSYQKPREVTWITGIVLLLIILAFSLSGYLLPWDQKAYWATIVTINIARSGPFGEYLGGLLTGGDTLGALTLLRWYSAHVFLLPAALVGFVAAHLYLMRRHGISGPVKAVAGPAKPFYPYQALKDTIAMAVVFSLLLMFAVLVPAPLDEIVDATDDNYIPRPEWYFMSLFQLLKYFPGPLEPVATIVIPGLVVALLLALPFLDRGPDRHPRRRPLVMGGFAVLGVGIISLTYLGLEDTPAHADPSQWSPIAIAGRDFVQDERCVRCHVQGGAANPIADTRLTRDPEWLLSHVRDPEVIAPGLRQPPQGGMGVSQAQSILAYMRQTRASAAPPAATGEELVASVIIGRYCVSCHMIDGEGESSAPDLTMAGAERDATYLREWISDPEAIDPFTDMPAFGDTLSEEQMTALVNYLAARR